MQRIFRILVVIVVIVVGVVWYFHWSRNRAMNSGEVHVRPQPTETAKATPESTSVSQPTQDLSASTAPSQSENHAETPGVYTLPASETLSRTPPDRTILAGTGRFELYRQGDITWRMDTASGQACVLFATEAMWRRSLVYEHGCGATR